MKIGVRVCMHISSALKSGSKVVELFSCLHQLSMKSVLLINLKLTIAIYFLRDIAEHNALSANKYEHANYCRQCHIY